MRLDRVRSDRLAGRVLVSAAALLFPLAGASAQPVDTVRVEVAAGRAIVEQRVPNVGDRVEALAIRFPGQTLDVIEVIREGAQLLDALLVEEPGVHRFTVTSGAPVTIRYEVTGEARRIPLFVTGGRAELAVARDDVRPFLLVVRTGGADGDRFDEATSLPRLEGVAPGRFEVRLSSLPSFLRLAAGGPLSFARLADALALLLIACGALFAWRRASGGARRGPASREDGT